MDWVIEEEKLVMRYKPLSKKACTNAESFLILLINDFTNFFIFDFVAKLSK